VHITRYAAPPPVAKPVEAPMVSSATIVLGDKATTHGEIRFDFTPAGGETRQVRGTVTMKKKAKDVAKDIEKEFKIVVGPNFKVERSPGQVKIKGNKKGVMFRLTLVAQTANGLSVRIQ
jgi:hypothetical protein